MKWIVIPNLLLLSDITYAECIVLSAIQMMNEVDTYNRKRAVSWLLKDFMSRPTISLSFKSLLAKRYIDENFNVIYSNVTPHSEADTTETNYYPTVKC